MKPVVFWRKRDNRARGRTTFQRFGARNSDRHAIGDAFEVFVLPFADDPELVPALEVVEPEPIEP